MRADGRWPAPAGDQPDDRLRKNIRQTGYSKPDIPSPHGRGPTRVIRTRLEVRKTETPSSRGKGTTFQLSIPPPSLFGGKYDPTSRARSTPTLVKGSTQKNSTKRRKPTRRPETRNRKIAKPKPSKEADGLLPTLKAAKTHSKNRQDYERLRGQRPERKEALRKYKQEKRESAKALGICKHCGDPAIPDQTRCKKCAGKHQVAGRASAAKRYAEKKEARVLKWAIALAEKIAVGGQPSAGNAMSHPSPARPGANGVPTGKTNISGEARPRRRHKLNTRYRKRPGAPPGRSLSLVRHNRLRSQ